MFLRRVACALLLSAFTAFAFAAEPPSAKSVANDPRVQSALELARTWLEAKRAYDRIPGVSAEIVYDQEVLWSGGFGLADVEAKRPATTETIYSIFTARRIAPAAGYASTVGDLGRFASWQFRLLSKGGTETAVQTQFTQHSNHYSRLR
jgi:CubicO group peptidase (beta-lactamase class C family)